MQSAMECMRAGTALLQTASDQRGFQHRVVSLAVSYESLMCSKWAFASDGSRVDPQTIAIARQEVISLTHPGRDMSGAGPSTRGHAVATLSTSDRQLAFEADKERRNLQRKSERKSAFERADDLAPKSGGKEGRMDERKATNAANRELREKDSAAGLEIPEATLMGGGTDFAAAYVAT